MTVTLAIVAVSIALFAMLMALDAAWQGWMTALLLAALMLAPLAWAAFGFVRAQWRSARAQNKAPSWIYFLALNCPHCHHQAMPLLRKWLLGWSKTGTCRHCGQQVLNDDLPIAMLAGPPLLGLLLAALASSMLPGLNVLHTIFWLTLSGVLVSLLLALWRPFLKLPPPTWQNHPISSRSDFRS